MVTQLPINTTRYMLYCALNSILYIIVSLNRHDLIGMFLTNVAELSVTDSTFELKNPKKADKKKYVNSGTVSHQHMLMPA